MIPVELRSIESVLYKLESFMRGGNQSSSPSAYPELLSSSRSIVYDLCETDVLNLSKIDESTSSQFATAAVALYNKSRNLSSNGHAELRVILRALSAWILYIYTERSLKVVSIIAKILGKTVHDLLRWRDYDTVAVKSAKVIIDLWLDSELRRNLTPLELQDMKISAFYGYLAEANLMICTSKPLDLENMKKCISSAMEITQMLSVGIKVQFSEMTLQLGLRLVEINYEKEAIDVLKLSLLSMEDILSMNGQNTRSLENDLNSLQLKGCVELKLKAHLSLTYAYANTSQIALALASINLLQHDCDVSKGVFPDSLKLSISFARLSIHVKDSNLGAAQSALRELLTHPAIDFQMALFSVKSVVDLCRSSKVSAQCKVDCCSESYTLLAAKFHRDPEYTCGKISNIQGLLSGNMISNEENDKALVVFKTIISEQESIDITLNKENYTNLKSILLNLVQMYRMSSKWVQTEEWTTNLIQFLTRNIDEEENIKTLMLIEVDSLLKQTKFKEAFVVAKNCVRNLRSTQSILMLFYAELHVSESSMSAVQTLLESQRMYCTPGGEKFKITEDLNRITMCMNIAFSSNLISKEFKYQVFQNLCLEWLNFYEVHKAWGITVTDNIVDFDIASNSVKDESMKSFFAVAYASAHMFLLQNLLEVHPNAPIEITRKLLQPVTTDLDSKSQIIEPTEIIMDANSFSQSTIAQCFTNHSTDLDQFPSPDKYLSNIGYSTIMHEILSFSCGLKEIDEILLKLFDRVYRVIKFCNDTNINNLGTSIELKQCGELAMTLGYFLMNPERCKFRKSKDVEEKNSEDQLNLAANFFEFAELILTHFPQSTYNAENGLNECRIICRLLSAAIRLDLESNLKETKHYSLENLTLANVGLRKVNTILKELTSEFDRFKLLSLERTCLILEFAAHCKARANQSSIETAEFIENRVNDFLKLTVLQICKCAEIVILENSETMECSRKIYQIALQVCHRENGHDFLLMGEIFVKIVELAPSRCAAYEAIEEFEQTVKLQTSLESAAFNVDAIVEDPVIYPNDISPFSLESIDMMVTLSYNYGITLIDLDQLDLANKFIVKAISLLPFSSSSIKSWLAKIQETHCQILNMISVNSSLVETIRSANRNGDEYLHKDSKRKREEDESFRIEFHSEKEGPLNVDSLK
eukprot:gene6211-8556_t